MPEQNDAQSPDERVSVEILGERYVIRGHADPGYIAEVARLVDERMRELQGSARGINRSRLAVLTAINLADELLQERDRDSEERHEFDEVTARTRQLITLLDEGLIGDAGENV